MFCLIVIIPLWFTWRLIASLLFLQKPFSRAELARTVRTALEAQAVGATSAEGLVG